MVPLLLNSDVCAESGVELAVGLDPEVGVEALEGDAAVSVMVPLLLNSDVGAESGVELAVGLDPEVGVEFAVGTPGPANSPG